MKKKLIVLVVGLCLAMTMLACAAPAPTPAPTPPTPAPTPAPTPQVFTIKYTGHAPEASPYSQAQNWYLTEVEKRTSGRVKFERYWGGSLVPAESVLEAIKSGAADSGLVVGSYSPGKTPLQTVGFLAATHEYTYVNLSAWHDLNKQMKPLQDELAQYNARFMSVTGNSANMLILMKPVRTLADLKGMKLRGFGDQEKLIAALGATPISMTSPEQFEAMQRGTIDGTVTPPAGVLAYSLQDVGKYWYELSFGGISCTMAINQGVWDKLPADIQKIMEEVALDHPKAFHEIYQIKGDGAGIEAMKAKGIQFSSPSAEEVAEVKQIAKDKLWDSWATEMEAKGLPGKNTLATFLNLLKKYEDMNPFKQ